MDGKDRVALQVRAGVRGTVMAIDAVRIHLGFTNATSLTPIAESRLRQGYVSKKQCKLLCALNDATSPRPRGIILTFPQGYPHAENLLFELVPHPTANTVDMDMGMDMETPLRGDEALNAKLAETLESMRDVKRDCGLEGCAVDFIQAAQRILLEGATAQYSGAAVSSAAGEDPNGVFMQMLLDGVEDDSDEEDVATTVTATDVNGDLEVVPLASSSIVVFACKKCRAEVCTQRQLTHNSTCGGNNAAVLFLEHDPDPRTMPEWVANCVRKSEAEGKGEGKLMCGCGAKLGAWSWVGQACPLCHHWIAPAFAIVGNKVDLKRIQSDVRIEGCQG